MSDQDRIEQAENRYEASWAQAQKTIALSSLAVGTVLTMGGYWSAPTAWSDAIASA